jgi:Skp family chaperone for outer membrane proteins
MKRTFVLVLAAGLATSSLAAQTAPPAAAAAPAAPAAAAPPQAIPAKIAIIALQQGMIATNEGQRALADIQKKYEPQRAKLETQGAELDSLKKQQAALPPNAPDEQRSNLIKNIDAKEKQLNFDADTAQTAYRADVAEAFGKIQQRFGTAAVAYCNANGFTLLVSPESEQNSPNPILWWNQATDITQAVITAYNTSSGVAAPPPSAPRPHPAASSHPTGSAAPAVKKQ